MRASARARRLSTSKSSPVIGPHGLDQTPKKPPPRPTTACDDINDASPYRQAAAQARRSVAEVRLEREQAKVAKEVGAFDNDGDGKLDVQELMVLLGVETEAEAMLIINKLDMDGDGELDMSELASLRERAAEMGLLGAQQTAQAAAKAADLARMSASRARKAQTESMEQIHRHLALSLGLSVDAGSPAPTVQATAEASVVPTQASSAAGAPVPAAAGDGALEVNLGASAAAPAAERRNLKAVGNVPVAVGRMGASGGAEASGAAAADEEGALGFTFAGDPVAAAPSAPPDEGVPSEPAPAPAASSADGAPANEESVDGINEVEPPVASVPAPAATDV